MGLAREGVGLAREGVGLAWEGVGLAWEGVGLAREGVGLAWTGCGVRSTCLSPHSDNLHTSKCDPSPLLQQAMNTHSQEMSQVMYLMFHCSNPVATPQSTIPHPQSTIPLPQPPQSITPSSPAHAHQHTDL